MNLRDLEYVVAVADHQNFTKAAQAQHVSQPALSSQIRKLERELGSEIFERRQGSVELTDFGRQITALARQINSLANRIDETAAKFRQIDATPLRLGTTPTLAAYMSRYTFEMFESLFPDLKLVIVEEKPVELARLVETQQIDFAFIARKSHELIFGPEPVRGLKFRPIWLEPLFLGVRVGHWLADAPEITAQDVPRELLLRFDVPFGYALEADLPDPDPRAAEMVGIDVRSARFETVCRHVAQSEACTIINAIAAIQFKQDKLGLTFVPFAEGGNLRELGIISRPNYSRGVVVERVQAYIQTQPPPGTIPYALSPEDRRAALQVMKTKLIEDTDSRIR
ncbi:MAG: LysR family transcriptional regulator [Pseudomonadota bacterium]